MLRRAICEPPFVAAPEMLAFLNANVVAALDLRDRFPQHIHDIGIHTGCLNARNIDYLDRQRLRFVRSRRNVRAGDHELFHLYFLLFLRSGSLGVARNRE